MGNRVVVGFQNRKDDPIIYLYQHHGDERDETLANAIYRANSRWNDADYATRIVISQLIGDSWNDILSYGISVNRFAMPDYEIHIVRWHSKTITKNSADDPEIEIESMSLDEFCDFSRFEKPATRLEKTNLTTVA